jgi:hypothetical protein
VTAQRHLVAALVGTAVGVLAGLLLLLGARALRPAPGARLPAPAPTPTPAPPANVPVARPATQPEQPEPEQSTARAPGTAVPVSRLAQAQAALETGARQFRGSLSAHLRLPSDQEAGLDAAREVPAGDLATLPLLAALRHAWRSGTLLRTAADEARARAMLGRGDHAAADFLLERVGRSQVNSWLEDHRYRGTRVLHAFREAPGARREGENSVTAADISRLLLALAESGTDPTAGPDPRDLLPTLETLPGRVAVGLQGTERRQAYAAVLIEGPSGLRYALVVLVTDAPSGGGAARGIPRLIERVHDALTGGE